MSTCLRWKPESRTATRNRRHIPQTSSPPVPYARFPDTKFSLELQDATMSSPEGEQSFLSRSLTRDARGVLRIPKETDDGSIEYKLRLFGVGDTRLEHLVTQLRFRWVLSPTDRLGCGS